MIDKVAPELFRVEIPLPNNPLKTVNSYIIRGTDRNLVIDTGMMREECERALAAGLQELDVDLARTDFFITHFHSDHLGLVSQLATDTSTVYFSELDAKLVASLRDAGAFWDRVAPFARKGGVPEAAIQEVLREHPGAKYGPQTYPEFTILGEGDVLRVGDYRFECVATPGHTPGHLCLYERDRKLFVSGDHILGNITPNISAWFENVNPLEDYLASLDKVSALDVSLVLPGHRQVFEDFQGRIAELEHHHQVSAEEVLAILATGSKTSYEVASEMTWHIAAATWDAFPVIQKWFATGEATAHLRYLEERGAVRHAMRNGTALFSL